MTNTENPRSIKNIFLFSLPIIAGQVGQMLFGVGDVLVASRYSSLAVGSIGVAATIFAPFLVSAIGVLLCTGPLASQIKGSGQKDPSFLFNAYIVSFILSVLMAIALFLSPYYVVLFKLTPEITPYVIEYLQWTAISIFPALIFQATKDYLQAYNKTYIPNAIILFFNILNVAFNYILMFGYGSFEGFGIKGAAIATLCCRYLMGIVIFIYMKSAVEFEAKLNATTIKQIFKIGFPISVTLLCEVLVFSTVTVLVGGISLVASAAQSIVINITSLTFMIPLGLGSAVSVLIGEEFGKKSLHGIKELTKNAMVLTVVNQMFFAFLYLTIPVYIISVASHDQDVILYASALLLWVGLFQIPDGIQVVLSGVLRGLNETKAPMFLGLIAYWLVGLPIGYYFAFNEGLEARGLWIGLALGLFMMCIFLIGFYFNRIKKLHRLM